MGAKTWTGVAVNMESASATAIVVNGITNASPAVVTFTGTDPANGNVVFLENISGIPEANNRPFRVAGLSAGVSFQLEGFDSTLLGTYVTDSGTAKVKTLSNSFTTFLSFSGTGGEASEIDITTVHDTIDQNVPGNKSAVGYSISSIWDPADAGFAAMEVADDDQINRVFEIRFSDNSRFYFGGRVSFLGAPTGDAGSRVETPASISVQGRGTNYAT